MQSLYVSRNPSITHGWLCRKWLEREADSLCFPLNQKSPSYVTICLQKQWLLHLDKALSILLLFLFPKVCINSAWRERQCAVVDRAWDLCSEELSWNSFWTIEMHWDVAMVNTSLDISHTLKIPQGSPYLLNVNGLAAHNNKAWRRVLENLKVYLDLVKVLLDLETNPSWKLLAATGYSLKYNTCH